MEWDIIPDFQDIWQILPDLADINCLIFLQ